ncbi:MAG TPA: hypothetical protein VKY40_07480 [Halanaerobiales bacterium]|nr:hypothetical protein [Halanaerobiales bacterium]
MARENSQKQQKKNKISKEEKKKIARAMIEGYKKMADINRELAEEGLLADDET